MMREDISCVYPVYTVLYDDDNDDDDDDDDEHDTFPKQADNVAGCLGPCVYFMCTLGMSAHFV